MLEKQQAVLRKYSDNIDPVGSGEIFGPEMLEKFLDAYVTKQTIVNEQLVALCEEQEDMEETDHELNSKTSIANAGKRLPGVNIVMVVKEDGAATIILSYGIVFLLYILYL